MRFVRYHCGERSTWGIKTGDSIHTLAGDYPSPTYEELANPSFRSRAQRLVDTGTLDIVPIDDVTVLAPVATPGKIIGVGLNYQDHADEQDVQPPDQPILFAKATSSVTNPQNPVLLPDEVEQLDYEVELAVVLGRTTHRVPATEAQDHIAGYTIANDLTARNIQFTDKQWFKGKGYNTFCPMGPTLVTDINPHDLEVELRVNGERKQKSNTENLIFGVYDLIEHISRVMTLHGGDVIITGTPGGVGIFRDPPELLNPGDTIEAEIEGLGRLENSVERA